MKIISYCYHNFQQKLTRDEIFIILIENKGSNLPIISIERLSDGNKA